MIKMLKSSLFSSAVVGVMLASFGMQAFGADARALFLSTAGTQVNYKPKTEVAQAKPKTEVAKTETKVIYKKVYVYRTRHKYYRPVERASETVPAGLSIQVLKVNANGVAVSVDPSVYKFRNGDEFAVSFEANTPGYVRVYNINPSGQVNYLGTYAVPAFMSVQLPSSGYFKFTGERGKEKLILELYPCKYKTTSYSENSDTSSRSIVLTSNSGDYGRVSDKVLESLPTCEATNNGLKVGSTVVAYNDNVMSRDISLSNSNAQYTSYDGGSLYYVSKIDTAHIKPITAVLTFIHR